MPLTHEQKADLGNRYLSAIKDRTAIRTKAKVRAETEGKAARKRADGRLPELACAWLKKHKLSVESFICAALESAYTSREYIDVLQIQTNEGIYKPSRGQFPELAKTSSELDRLKALNRDLCSEIGFLDDLCDSGAIAAFQTYVSRLWSPASKSVMIGDIVLKKILEDFIQTRRPFVCKLA